MWHERSDKMDRIKMKGSVLLSIKQLMIVSIHTGRGKKRKKKKKKKKEPPSSGKVSAFLLRSLH